MLNLLRRPSKQMPGERERAIAKQWDRMDGAWGDERFSPSSGINPSSSKFTYGVYRRGFLSPSVNVIQQKCSSRAYSSNTAPKKRLAHTNNYAQAHIKMQTHTWIMCNRYRWLSKENKALINGKTFDLKWLPLSPSPLQKCKNDIIYLKNSSGKCQQQGHNCRKMSPWLITSDL